MDVWFTRISVATHLPHDTAHTLLRDEFVLVPGPIPTARLKEISRLYDEAVFAALPEDVKVESTTTRVRDFVNRNAEFDDIYLYPPSLQACCRVIEQPFKLSTIHARTLRPGTGAQRLHVDFPIGADGWPMVGFIFMIDDFTPDNGATCFVSRSQGAESPPAASPLVQACGSAGSIIVFNGSIWHGHGPNRTDTPRRSIQGAYIRRSETSSETLPSRMRPETLNRIGAFAKYLLAL